MIARRYPGNLTLPSRTIEEPARRVPLYGEYEVVVLGGGPAGTRAAGAAGRAAYAADRTLWVPRRHGDGGGGDEFLRTARQCAWRDASGGAGHRHRPARAHRSARRAQCAASHSREDPGAGL